MDEVEEGYDTLFSSSVMLDGGVWVMLDSPTWVNRYF